MAALAVLLCSGSLQLGWHADDYMHRAVLTRPGELPGLVQSPLDIFAFIAGDPETNLELKRQGLLPWWSSPELRLCFFRPLSSLTHWMDYRLWPDSPWLMHAHSLLWLGLAVAAAAFLFRRFEPLPVAGLAALLFAVDDAHILPAMWLANRNTTISVAFGLLALIAHDRWRREGWKPGGILAPVSFLLSLLGAETGIAVAGYLLAYVLFIDRTNWQTRLKSAMPILLVSAGWWIAYRSMGYGARGSGLYIDPAQDPGRYLEAVLVRGPALLWGQFGLPSDLSLFLSENWSRALWLLTLGLMVALALVLARFLRGSNTACFWATGMLLSVLPSCSTFVSVRLLFFVGLGGMGLIAAFLRGALDRSHSSAGFPSLPVRIACRVLILVHLVLAPLGLLTAPLNLEAFRDVFNGPALTFPADPEFPADQEVSSQQVLIVTTPTSFVSLITPLILGLEGKPIPASSVILGSGIHATIVSRPESNTLVLRLRGGFLSPPGRPPSDGRGTVPPFDRRYAYQTFDHLFVADPRTRPGHVIDLGGIRVEIVNVTADGRPLEVAFHFDRELEDSSFRWIRWQDGIYVPFKPPPVGETIILPAIRLAPVG